MTRWTTISLKVATPLFSGDDPTPPPRRGTGTAFRVPSIRGQLRFWFRAVAAGHGLPARTVWEQEEAVFGSIRNDHTTASAIALRIDKQPKPFGAGTIPPWMNEPDPNTFSGAAYLLGPGLWQRDKATKESKLTRDYLRPGPTKIDLKIRLSPDDTINTRFFYTLWAWLTFGGLGARTHRGFGQLRVVDFDQTELPEHIWLAKDLQTQPATIDEWKTLLARPIPESAELTDDQHRWTLDPPPSPERPEYPSLAAPWWNGRVLPIQTRTLADAFDEAGEHWRRFYLRGPITHTTNQGQRRNNSTPEWAASIIGTDPRFPRGALGMPVVYHRPAGNGNPAFASTVTIDNNRYRRASPVWIRPVQLGPNTWTVITHAFRSRLLPDNTRITAGGDAGNKTLHITDDMADTAINAWLTDRQPQTPRIPRDYYDNP